ncbi:MAG: hypothetical protein QNJ46_07195 [Leptolyngbyaceae cyanobacterium MO_188.B28]|nr:hypothetical protein [Leptolyngbyaceae cyanobacterium MO_188.B28]
MNETAIAIVEWLINLARAYLIAGVIFAVIFLLFGVQRLDEGARWGIPDLLHAVTHFGEIIRSPGKLIQSVLKIAAAIWLVLVCLNYPFDKVVSNPHSLKIWAPVWSPTEPSLLQGILLLLAGLWIVGRSVSFRVLLIPGLSIFWPLFAVRWVRGKHLPEEQNAHRRLAKLHS